LYLSRRRKNPNTLNTQLIVQITSEFQKDVKSRERLGEASCQPHPRCSSNASDSVNKM